jgi:hypothetical protein
LTNPFEENAITHLHDEQRKHRAINVPLWAITLTTDVDADVEYVRRQNWFQGLDVSILQAMEQSRWDREKLREERGNRMIPKSTTPKPTTNKINYSSHKKHKEAMALCRPPLMAVWKGIWR